MEKFDNDMDIRAALSSATLLLSNIILVFILITNFNGYLVKDIASSILYRGAYSILPGVAGLIGLITLTHVLLDIILVEHKSNLETKDKEIIEDSLWSVLESSTLFGMLTTIAMMFTLNIFPEGSHNIELIALLLFSTLSWIINPDVIIGMCFHIEHKAHKEETNSENNITHKNDSNNLNKEFSGVGEHNKNPKVGHNNLKNNLKNISNMLNKCEKCNRNLECCTYGLYSRLSKIIERLDNLDSYQLDILDSRIGDKIGDYSASLAVLRKLNKEQFVRNISRLIESLDSLISPIEAQMMEESTEICDSVINDLKLYSEIEKSHINKLEPIRN